LEGQSQISGDTILIFIPPQADKYNTKVYPPSLWQATSSGLRQYFQIHFTPKIRQTKAKNPASGRTFVFFLAASREPDILLLTSDAHFEDLNLVAMLKRFQNVVSSEP